MPLARRGTQAATGLPGDVTIQGMPLSCAVAVIVYHIRAQSSFFTIDAASREDFKTLSAEEFLSELLVIMWESGLSEATDDQDEVQELGEQND